MYLKFSRVLSRSRRFTGTPAPCPAREDAPRFLASARHTCTYADIVTRDTACNAATDKFRGAQSKSPEAAAPSSVESPKARSSDARSHSTCRLGHCALPRERRAGAPGEFAMLDR